MKTLRMITLLMHVGALALVLAVMHRDRVPLGSLSLSETWVSGVAYYAHR